MLNLSPHFTLAEFERSATAKAHGIDNTCPSMYIPSLQQLCKTILEPLRTYVNSDPKLLARKPSLCMSASHEIPIVITSGYRCNQLNVKVGGAYASQHTVGEAANIFIPKTPYTDWDDGIAHTDKELAEQWLSWLQHNVSFDQLIMETANGRDFWIHVSCRKNSAKNRHQVLRLTKK